jgi:hypothetical protein
LKQSRKKKFSRKQGPVDFRSNNTSVNRKTQMLNNKEKLKKQFEVEKQKTHFTLEKTLKKFESQFEHTAV